MMLNTDVNSLETKKLSLEVELNDLIKNNAEQEMQRGVPERSLADATSSVSNNSIPQKSDLSTDSLKLQSWRSDKLTYSPFYYILLICLTKKDEIITQLT